MPWEITSSNSLTSGKKEKLGDWHWYMVFIVHGWTFESDLCSQWMQINRSDGWWVWNFLGYSLVTSWQSFHQNHGQSKA